MIPHVFIPIDHQTALGLCLQESALPAELLETLLAMETAEHSHPHLGPVGDVFHLAAHHRDVSQKHQYGEKQSGKECPAEQYLDALRHESIGDALYHSLEVGMACRHPNAVDISGTACEAVAHIVFHPSGMQRRSHESAHEHVEDIEY